MERKISVLGWEKFERAYNELMRTPEWYISGEQISNLTKSYSNLKMSLVGALPSVELNLWDDMMLKITTRMKLRHCPIK